MNNRNFDEMIERYKREMVNCQSRCRRAVSPPKNGPCEPRAMQNEEAKNGSTAREKLTGQGGEEKTDCGTAVNESAPSASGDDMLKCMARSCEKNGDRNTCSELNEFLKKNSEKGSMSINVFAWDTQFGVSSARVIVLVPLKSGNVMVFNGITDSNGKTEEFVLPAPPRAESLDEEGTPSAAYAGYTVVVEHPDYQRAMFYNVPVFEGIESVQPVNLFAAMGEGGSPGVVIPEPESTIDEKEEN